MKKFNGMESKLIIDALDCYITQVEKDILELEKVETNVNGDIIVYTANEWMKYINYIKYF